MYRDIFHSAVSAVCPVLRHRIALRSYSSGRVSATYITDLIIGMALGRVIFLGVPSPKTIALSLYYGLVNILLGNPFGLLTKSRISQEIRQADFPNQKTLLDATMMTMKTMDSAVVSKAMILVDTLYPDRNTIIQVSDTAFALRHFKSKYFKPPSSSLKRYAASLYGREQGLLMLHELYELQAQLARIPLEDLPTLVTASRRLVRGAGIIFLKVKTTLEREQLPLHTTRKLVQALDKCYANKIVRARAIEGLVLGARQWLFKKGFTRKDYDDINDKVTKRVEWARLHERQFAQEVERIMSGFAQGAKGGKLRAVVRAAIGQE